MNILIIDDDNFMQKMFARYLSKEHDTDFASNGEEGLRKAAEVLPDVILLDVEMPGMNGYEVCDQIKNSDDTRHIPVIFVSSHDALRDRMQGYEAGGDDYLVKPFEPETLLAKVNVFGKHHVDKKQLQTQFEVAQKTAQIAMTGSSELGLVMQFVENSYNIFNYAELASGFFSVTDRLGLKCTLIFLTNEEPEYFSSPGSVSPLEQELLSMMRKEKRFYDFGCRTIINYPNVSLLIKNMPVDDMEHYGRVKDLLPALLGAANGKVFSLNAEYALTRQSLEMTTSIDAIKETLLSLTNSVKLNQQKGTSILNQMLMGLNQSLPNMGLEEDQEVFILECVETAIERNQSVTDASEELNQTFHQILGSLQQLSDNQQKLINDMLEKQHSDVTPANEDEYTMDVELF